MTEERPLTPQFHLLAQQELFPLPRGIKPPTMKIGSSAASLRQLPLPDRLVIPLRQHQGPAGKLKVCVGQYVAKGEPLTQGGHPLALPVHAPTSGTITALSPADASSYAGEQIVLHPDGCDSWRPRCPMRDYQQQSVSTLIDRICQSGIAGLGGAGFPTSAKWLPQALPAKLLIINGVECEPYITADACLMENYAQAIVQGCQILRHILRPQQCVIAIEADKPQALKAVQQALQKQPCTEQATIALRTIPTQYPAGAAKQLIWTLTGQEISQGSHASALGIIVHNVATLFAIQRAIIEDEPLIERIVTITGSGLEHPGNFWVRLGTPAVLLLQQCGWNHLPNVQLISGGPLMGTPLLDWNTPVTKTTQCLLLLEQQSPLPQEQACIRCGACATVCPVGLLPQQLYWYSRSENHALARAHHLSACIECGACSYVCPSHIPLVHYYRQEKAQLQVLEKQQQQALQAKTRFTAKQQRMAQKKWPLQVPVAPSNSAHTPASSSTTTVPTATPQMVVSAALARARARARQQHSLPRSVGKEDDPGC